MLRPKAAIDFTIIDPVPVTKTVAMINSFVVSTSQFLNKFVYLCEQKLNSVSSEIERIEIMTLLLEERLKSIPGLEGITEPPVQSAISTSLEVISSSSPSMVAESLAPIVTPPSAPVEDVSTPLPPPPASLPVMRVRDDPRYSRFFKMLAVGVAEENVRVAMVSMGIDPAILSQPDAPVSDAPPPAQQEEWSDDE